MALSYTTRRRLALLLLLVGLPVWIVLAVNLVDLFDRPPILLEVAIYVGLGVIWALPFKALFRGIGQPDPHSGPEKSRAAGDDPAA